MLKRCTPFLLALALLGCLTPAWAAENLIRSSVANLPTSGPAGMSRIVTDGADGGDCTSGGGVFAVICTFNGTDTWTAGGSAAGVEADTLQTVFARGDTIATSEAAPLKIRGLEAQATSGWNIYMHSGGTPTIKCVIDDVEGDCDVVVSIDSGNSWIIKNSTGDTLFSITEAGVISATHIGFVASDTNPACGAGNYNIFADLSETKLKKCTNGVATDLDTTSSGGDTFVRKTADETVNNSAVMQDDDALLFAAEANATYAVEVFVMYTSTTVADWKIEWTLPAGASGLRHYQYNTGNTCVTFSGAGHLWTQQLNGIAGTGGLCSFTAVGTVITAGTAGNVVFEWTQNTQEATNTVVHAGSYIRYRKIS